MLTLHGYWRSSAAYRVRIALEYKGIAYTQRTYDLRRGEQSSDAYRALNPQGLVPALETPDGMLAQSPAILEWLEERYPTPPLLPQTPAQRAIVRAMAAIIGCDIHPLNNLRVLNTIRSDFGAGAEQVSAWTARWIRDGFAALEAMIGQQNGPFALGNSPTLADCYIVPQVYSAERFAIELTPYPRLFAAAQAARELPAFSAAHPQCQPDAD